jgi:hypothetical protein
MVLTPAGALQAPALNYPVIAERARHLGLSTDGLAARTGLRLPDLEHRLDCLDPRRVSLLLLSRLSRVLDLPIPELLTTTPEPAGAPPDPNAVGNAAQHVIDGASWPDHAVLHATLYWTGTVSIDEICTVLDWSQQRLAAAVATLDERLAGGPVGLSATDETLALTLPAGLLSPERQQRLSKARLARQPLSPNQARELVALVRAAIFEPLPAETYHNDPSLGGRNMRWGAQAGWLIQRGLAELTEDTNSPPERSPIIAHPDVMFALGLATTPAATPPTAP